MLHMGRRTLWPWQADVRAGDADRERVADELARHCAEGRLTSDELSERVDVALRARTLSELAAVTRDLPRLAPAPRLSPHRWRLAAGGAAALALLALAALGADFVELLSQDALGAVLAVVVVLLGIVLAATLLGSLLVALAPLIAAGLAVRWIGRRLGGALDAGGPRTRLRA
jgi:hypothetical protein